MGFCKQVLSISSTISKLTAKGAEVIVRTEGSFEVSIPNAEDAKKNSKFKTVSTTDDVWVKVGQKWMLKKVTVIKETNTVDGKKVGG
jgi:hypothetical protein